MKLRTLLGGVVGAAGAAVVSNRVLASRAGELENPLPGVERSYRWRGMDVTYTAAGDPADPDLLLVHGIHAAASSHEFRPIFEELAEQFHVVAVDLPGFGRSDRPPLVYSATLYTEFLREFAADVLEEPAVIVPSLSASFVAAAASEGGFSRLVFVCPSDDGGSDRPWLRTLLRSPVVGTALFNLLASKPAVEYFFARDGYYDGDAVEADAVDYAWRSAHRPGARFAPASLLSGALDPGIELAEAIETAGVPTTLVWGREAERRPLREGRRLAGEADLDLIVVDYATLLPHAERPADVLAGLEDTLVEAE